MGKTQQQFSTKETAEEEAKEKKKLKNETNAIERRDKNLVRFNRNEVISFLGQFRWTYGESQGESLFVLYLALQCTHS